MEKLIIGILTFQKAHNYGAVLQAFALLNVLKDMGHEAEIINYWPEYREGQYNLFNFHTSSEKNATFFLKSKEFIKKVLSFLHRRKMHVKFTDFIKNHLEIKNTLYTSGADIPDKYDLIICGSDQIWRYNYRTCNGFDEVFFAEYPRNKRTVKVSYAASMGDKDLDEDAKDFFNKLIKNFDLVSVREESLFNLVKPVASKTPDIVLDPVFLLSFEKWKKLININVYKRKYLLFYQLLNSPKASALAKKIAKERHLEIIEIRGSADSITLFDAKNINHTAGPIDFITLIAHADFVVSTSFHGIVFSVVFQKQFLATGFKNKSYRIKTLLKSLGIEQSSPQNNPNIPFNNIDYNSVNARLEELRKNSFSFLENSINKAKNIKKDILSSDIV